MRSLILSSTLALACAAPVYAQDAGTTNVEAGTQKHFNHYVGVQVNGLIRQVLNFSNTTPTAQLNPYLLIYSVNHKSGWGLRAGIGYQKIATWSNDGVTETDTRINDVNARLGVERSFDLSSKWSAGIGIDGLYNSSDDYTKAIVRSTDTVTTITKSKLPAMGAGLMGWLRYKISNRVLLGTETSFTYVTGEENREVTITRKERSLNPPFVFNSVTTTTKSKPIQTDISFKMPVVFYLIIKM
jgi:opacity protein-like surface antigen